MHTLNKKSCYSVHGPLKITASIIAMSIFLFFMNIASAALAICQGKVESIVNRPGYVYLKLDTSEGSFVLCASDSQNFSISPESCKDFKSTAYIAFVTGKPLMVYINNALTSNGEPYGCPVSVVPNNLNADITYMHLTN